MTPEPGNKQTKEPENLPEHPRGYFEAQVVFAEKATLIQGITPTESLTRNTALYRRLFRHKFSKGSESPKWRGLMESCTDQDAETITNILYSWYLSQPHSKYEDPIPKNDGFHFGIFRFEPLDNGKVIKVHVSSLKRGEKSELASVNRDKRQEEMKQMFTAISQSCPQAETVIGGSWLYNTVAYRNIYPPEFIAHMVRLVPEGYPVSDGMKTGMSLQGDSIWGQFLNSQGGIKYDLVDRFMAKIKTAATWKELIDAFPNPVWQPKCAIENFYSYYNISPIR